MFDPSPLLFLHILADGVLVGPLPQVPIADLPGPPDLQDVLVKVWSLQMAIVVTLLVCYVFEYTCLVLVR